MRTSLRMYFSVIQRSGLIFPSRSRLATRRAAKDAAAAPPTRNIRTTIGAIAGRAPQRALHEDANRQCGNPADRLMQVVPLADGKQVSGGHVPPEIGREVARWRRGLLHDQRDHRGRRDETAERQRRAAQPVASVRLRRNQAEDRGAGEREQDRFCDGRGAWRRSEKVLDRQGEREQDGDREHTSRGRDTRRRARSPPRAPSSRA